MKVTIFIVCSLLAVSTAAAQSELSKSVVGGGGGDTGGTAYAIRGTVGQPGIGVSGSPAYETRNGYWYGNDAVVTAVTDAGGDVPATYRLDQNFPNPFNPSTTIRYAVPERTVVTLRVYDVGGREVATLVDGEMTPGEHAAQWNATGLASGVYFYRLQAGGFVETRKLVLLK